MAVETPTLIENRMTINDIRETLAQAIGRQ
jgi:hypothetical protein